ncbi:hypothetical protein ABIE61_003299 [Marinobacterium sp. MBR-111]|jgi:hypothetical protein
MSYYFHPAAEAEFLESVGYNDDWIAVCDHVPLTLSINES